MLRPSITHNERSIILYIPCPKLLSSPSLVAIQEIYEHPSWILSEACLEESPGAQADPGHVHHPLPQAQFFHTLVSYARMVEGYYYDAVNLSSKY